MIIGSDQTVTPDRSSLRHGREKTEPGLPNFGDALEGPRNTPNPTISNARETRSFSSLAGQLRHLWSTTAQATGAEAETERPAEVHPQHPSAEDDTQGVALSATLAESNLEKIPPISGTIISFAEAEEATLAQTVTREGKEDPEGDVATGTPPGKDAPGPALHETSPANLHAALVGPASTLGEPGSRGVERGRLAAGATGGPPSAAHVRGGETPPPADEFIRPSGSASSQERSAMAGNEFAEGDNPPAPRQKEQAASRSLPFQTQVAVLERPGPSVTPLPVSGGPGAALLDGIAGASDWIARAGSVARPWNAEATAARPADLRIQLTPAHLGTITARMQLEANRLVVEIQVETAEALERLGAERETIERALRAIGLEVEQITLQQATGAARENQSGTATRDNALQGDRGAEEGNDERLARDKQENSREGGSRQNRPGGSDPARARGGIYI
jgi:hypothetical protein